jgi:hypothetical protein
MQDEYKDRTLKKNDVVSLHIEELRKLKSLDAKRYKKILTNLEEINALTDDDNYIVFEDEKEGEVLLVGKSKDKDSETGYAKTDRGTPVQFLFYVEPLIEDENGLAMSASDRKYFGLEDEESGIDAKATGSEAAKEVVKKGPCFIATVCYGDYDAPEVRILREFRDGHLKRLSVGLMFIRCYYQYGPYAGKVVKRSKILTWTIRNLFLQPIVSILKHRRTTDS